MEKALRKIDNICRFCLCKDDELSIPFSSVIGASLSIQDVENLPGAQNPQIVDYETVSYATCVECGDTLKSSCTA
uniref:ZAD domain-containing protein n=1 Tax=Anopheles dirus TaxID=7168 RepID=A0A182NYE2_9DIPT